MEHMQRVWIASRGRLPFRTSGSVFLYSYEAKFIQSLLSAAKKNKLAWKETSTYMKTQFSSNFINIMDHIRFSGT